MSNIATLISEAEGLILSGRKASARRKVNAAAALDAQHPDVVRLTGELDSRLKSKPSQTMKQSKMKFVATFEGWSESAWKSLAVKALRIGWPNGLREASDRIGKSKLDWLLLVSIFEDIFPVESELPEIMREIRKGDYDALCARDTHHGRGYSDRFCDLKDESMAIAKDKPDQMIAEAKRLKLFLPTRSFNCLWTWLQLRPDDLGAKRSIDTRPFTAMLTDAIDGHCKEGKQRGIRETYLSGHYATHRNLGRLVQQHGWENIRTETFSRLEEKRT